jgi:hypothetical protein
MRAPRLLFPVLFLLAGCNAGTESTDPQGAPPALRNGVFPAASVSYRVEDGAANTTNYTRGPGFSDGTSVSVSQDGTEVTIATATTVDSGGQVLFNDTLTLPPSMSEFNGPLHWPQQNRSLFQSAFGSWDLPGSSGVPATGTFFAFGVLTDGSAIQVTGNATYTGRWTGVQWTVAGGATFTGTEVFGNFTGVVNYVDRTITVTALGPTGLPMLSGTLSYAQATNSPSSSLMTGPTGYTSGSAVARFFGPQDEELGGTFRVMGGASPSGTNVIIGSFGAKRP